MEWILKFINLVFIGFFALFPPVNPVGTALIVDPFLHGLSFEERKKASRRIASNCFLICGGTILIGSWLFNLFGISLPVVQLAGGLLICHMGWQLLNPNPGIKESETQAQTTGSKIEGLLFYPLAFPMTTGAGTISVLLTLSAHGRGHTLAEYTLDLGALVVAIGLMSFSIYLCYAYTPKVLTRLGPRGQQILNRLSAFLVFCVGLQIGVMGLEALVKSWIHPQ